MVRRRIRDDNAPRSSPWLNTYADMVTLLMTFFILLFAMSILNQSKFMSVMGSLQGAFGILEGAQPKIFDPKDILPSPEADLNLVEMELAHLEKMGEAFLEELRQESLADLVSTKLEERGLVLRLADSLLFDLGSADLRMDAGPVLNKVGELISGIPNPVKVEGHTDNWPISTEKFPSNWELSTGRAASVVRFLLANFDVYGGRLQAGGYGEHHPIDTNGTVQGRQKNRRVDIIILRASLFCAEPQGTDE